MGTETPQFKELFNNMNCSRAIGGAVKRHVNPGHVLNIRRKSLVTVL